MDLLPHTHGRSKQVGVPCLVSKPVINLNRNPVRSAGVARRFDNPVPRGAHLRTYVVRNINAFVHPDNTQDRVKTHAEIVVGKMTRHRLNSGDVGE